MGWCLGLCALAPAQAAAPPLSLPTQESPCWPVVAFELKGERAGEFPWALDAAIRKTDPPKVRNASGQRMRCLGEQGLEVVMLRVQNAVIERGFVNVHVTPLAGQDRHSGVFTMVLTTGVVREVRLSPDSDPHAHLDNALTLRPGQLLNRNDILQSQDNLQRLPSVKAEVLVTRDDDTATAHDVLVRWTQKRPWRAKLGLDDAGSRVMGRLQGSANVEWDHPLGFNDQLALNLSNSLGRGWQAPQGTRGRSLSYSLPAGAWQWSASANSSQYHLHVVSVDGGHEYSGNGHNLDLRAAHAMFRDGAHTTLTGHGLLWVRNSKNFTDGKEVWEQRRRTRGWEGGLTLKRGGDAPVEAGVAYRTGVGGLGALPAPEEALNEGTSRMRLFTLQAQWKQPFRLGAQSLHYQFNLRAQRNQTRLTPQDRFGIGGRSTVRGFSGENGLAAERGWLVRNDVVWRWHPWLQGYVALDHGQVSGPSAAQLTGTQLTGMAWGLRGDVKDTPTGTWSYDIFVGRPLRQPDSFPEKATIGGFQVNWAY